MASKKALAADIRPRFPPRLFWTALAWIAAAAGAGFFAYGLALPAEGVGSARFEFASGLLSAAAFAYLLGFACYLWDLAWGKDLAGRIASLVTLTGASLHTAGLLVRWTLSGLEQPPWTNLYESLVYFAWGIAVVYLVFEWRSASRAAGAFVVPVALIMMGLAAFSPDHSKEIPQIMPALQSKWIKIHVTFACIAYAAFLSAFGFAILFLVKDKLPVAFMAAVYSIFAIVMFLSFGFGDVLLHAEFALKAPTIIGTGEMMNYPQPVPYSGQLFLVSLLLYGAAAACHFAARKSPVAARYQRPAFAGAFAAHTAGLGAAFYHAVSTHPIPMRPQLTLLQWDVNAYLLALVSLTWLGSAVILILDWRAERLEATLPSREILDDWSYKGVLVGLPLMTLNLITGAIWANNAWGSYWSWDPKETWALITFLVYAAYIHARIARGWMGRKSAALAIAGFCVVLFTYLGVNLFLSGLHSYGSPK